MNQTAEFTRTIERLAQLYPKLPRVAAIVAVNFSKERFRMQNWVDRSREPWKKRKDTKSKGRAILVKTGRLKRDVQVISVGRESAVVGTSNLTTPYAKTHNEGYTGTVTVKGHTRHRYKKVKESYTTRGGITRSRTSKQVSGSTIAVRTHTRKMNLPARRFLGPSAVMDRRIERELTKQFINALKGQ